MVSKTLNEALVRAGPQYPALVSAFYFSGKEKNTPVMWALGIS